jgi:glycoprotein 6-alpha-L-fucosyltransferase
VRRTDKIGTEGSFHNISEYMIHVEDYYNKIELLEDSVERKVYLATDDPNVWKECINNYPNYKFIGNEKAAIFASKLKTRYNFDSFMQLVIDIYLLSETDFIVCTMSSGVSFEEKKV